MNYYIFSYSYSLGDGLDDCRLYGVELIVAANIGVAITRFNLVTSPLRYTSITTIFSEKFVDKEDETRMERRNDADSSKEAG